MLFINLSFIEQQVPGTLLVLYLQNLMVSSSKGRGSALPPRPLAQVTVNGWMAMRSFELGLRGRVGLWWVKKKWDIPERRSRKIMDAWSVWSSAKVWVWPGLVTVPQGPVSFLSVRNSTSLSFTWAHCHSAIKTISQTPCYQGSHLVKFSPMEN